MLRSFHYAVFSSLFSHTQQGALGPETLQHIDSATRFWHRWVGAIFLRAYLETAGPSSYIPREKGELLILLRTFVLEKAVYELGYELNNRPGWVKIPLQGIGQLCREAD
jgi:maltose alpha-D-glucosyltransferase/alpha-amylase